MQNGMEISSQNSPHIDYKQKKIPVLKETIKCRFIFMHCVKKGHTHFSSILFFVSCCS